MTNLETLERVLLHTEECHLHPRREKHLPASCHSHVCPTCRRKLLAEIGREAEKTLRRREEFLRQLDHGSDVRKEAAVDAMNAARIEVMAMFGVEESA